MYMSDIVLKQGDAYELIKQIPDKSIDLIVTDPPYDLCIPKKRKVHNQLDSHIQKLCDELSAGGLDQGINLVILDEFMRVLKKPNIYIWCNKKQIIPYLLYFVHKHKCKFEILTWIKSNPVPLCGSNYLIDKEYCLYFRKGIKLHTTYDTAKTYWITQTNKADKIKYDHPTVKPLWIIEMLISNSSVVGDTVLDCFMGSGTTAEAAKNLNRGFVGFELQQKYIETAAARLI